MIFPDAQALPPFPRKVVLLGATGSIGSSALEVIRKHQDRFELVGISGRTRLEDLAAIQREFQVPHVCMADTTRYAEARDALGNACTLHAGTEGLDTLAALPEADLVLVALVGTAGLSPTLTAIEAGKMIALANKEVLVMAGKFVTAAVKAHGTALLPVDSEHNALFQCALAAQDRAAEIDRLVLTASGGAFRDRPLETFPSITIEEALTHPNWDMGPKVTIDSATMANKGLELIEARWLFDLPGDRLDVTLHPQSIVHSMVQFVDGSILAQMCPPSMTFPIQHSLLYPDRLPGVQPTLSFQDQLSLDFRPVSFERYPCLEQAYAAMKSGGVAETVFNAANEVAVAAFVDGRLPFDQIHAVIAAALEAVPSVDPNSLDDVFHADQEARIRAGEFLNLSSCSTL